MKILLINLDSTITNIALKKIEKYHLDKGDEVFWDLEYMAPDVDKIYVSCIFDWNKEKAWSWGKYPYAIVGGTGVDLDLKLPDEIEEQKPKINIGFTTRGCIRNCPFCVVQRKEGKLHVVGDIYDLWDGTTKDIQLLDNNIMGDFEHFKKIWGQIKQEKLRLKENGLDIRILDDKRAEVLTTLRIKYKFAFDNMKDEEAVRKGCDILRKHNIKEATFYVLVQFNTTLEEDLYRLNLIKELGFTAYVQRYKFADSDKRYIALAMWANQRHMYKKMSFEEFLYKGQPHYVQYFGSELPSLLEYGQRYKVKKEVGNQLNLF